MVGSASCLHWSKILAVFQCLYRCSRAAHLAEHLERREWCHERLGGVSIRAALEGEEATVTGPAVGLRSSPEADRWHSKGLRYGHDGAGPCEPCPSVNPEKTEFRGRPAQVACQLLISN